MFKRYIKKQIQSEIRPKVIHEVAQLLRFMFSDQEPEGWYKEYSWAAGAYRGKIKDDLTEGLADLVVSKLKKSQKEDVIEYLKDEEFIDSIVDRIRKKQLK